jgi:surface protein
MKSTRLSVISLAMACLFFGCNEDSPDEQDNNVTLENTAELCADGQDNDNNGVSDCDEASCAEFENCKDTSDEQEKACSGDMPEGKKNCTCDKTTGEWKDCQEADSNEPDDSNKPLENTEALCKDTIDNDDNGLTDCEEDSCAEFENCKEAGGDNVVADKDENGNHMKDSKEPGMASAQTCRYHHECTAPMFCDSFVGKCADKCTHNDDCMEGFICRPDGRCAAEAFETVWRTTTAQEAIALPTGLDTDTCDVTIDWGDGSATEQITECPTKFDQLKHTYAEAGDYHIKITGTWDGWCMGEGNSMGSCMTKENAAKLIEVVSYGPVGLANRGFAEAKNLSKLSSIDIPDSSKLGKKIDDNVYAEGMFYGCENLVNGISKWDVSNVTDLRHFLSGAKKFNEDLYRWNVSKVTHYSGMFWGAEALTSNPIGQWDLTAAKSMSDMFGNTTKPSLNYTCGGNDRILPANFSDCNAIKDMYTGSNVDCDIVDLWTSSLCEDAVNYTALTGAIGSCTKADYKAECAK